MVMAPSSRLHKSKKPTPRQVDAFSIVTITPSAGTTTIFITSSISPTSTSSSSSGGSNVNVGAIAGAAVGGFVGFGLVAGFVVWFVWFRRRVPSQPSPHPSGAANLGVVGAAAGQEKGSRRRTTDDVDRNSSTVISPPAESTVPTREPGAPSDNEKPPDGRPLPKPVQTVPASPPPNSKRPLSPFARPPPHRTITSNSENDGMRHIPVVIPSFAYRDSAASGSGSTGSRFTNVLKRGSGAASSTLSSGATPYEYGAVGSEQSRRGSTLAPDVSTGQFGHLYPGPADDAIAGGSSSYGSRLSSEPRQLSIPSNQLGYSHQLSSAGLTASASGSGHSADSNHPLMMAVSGAASASSHGSHSNSHSHSHGQEPVIHAQPEVSVARHPNRPHSQSLPTSPTLPPQRRTSSFDDHIALSNYILPPSSSSSSLHSHAKKGGRTQALKADAARSSTHDLTRGPSPSPVLRAGTMSDTGHASARIDSQPAASDSDSGGGSGLLSTFQRSFSLDLSSRPGNKLRRKSRPDQGPSSLRASAASPPPSSYQRHMSFGAGQSLEPQEPSRSVSSSPDPGPMDRDTSDETDQDAGVVEDQRPASRSRRRAGSGSHHGHSSSRPHSRSRHRGHRSSSAGSRRPRPSTGTSDEEALSPPPRVLGSNDAAGASDEELARLARTARRTERMIRRQSRTGVMSDPGHGSAPLDGSGTDVSGSDGRRRSRQRHGSSSRARRASAGTRPSSSESEDRRPRLVLRNV
ncbi:hypothetical protein DL93DRAFT_696662 [Clavulina sp. PMI_390]|nr:hypothetical protein DL93DRAFT_696662 [Clavulina sp. PMI_390]